MSTQLTSPFDSLESAHQYVGLLRGSVLEAIQEIERDLDETPPGASRRLEALRLAKYKLERLEGHLSSSRGLLNDLRMLRRLLLRTEAPTGR